MPYPYCVYVAAAALAGLGQKGVPEGNNVSEILITMTQVCCMSGSFMCK